MHWFPSRLLLYGSLSHCDVKLIEMTHQDVTGHVKKGQTNDKSMAPTILKRREVLDAYEY